MKKIIFWGGGSDGLRNFRGGGVKKFSVGWRKIFFCGGGVVKNYCGVEKFVVGGGSREIMGSVGMD